MKETQIFFGKLPVIPAEAIDIDEEFQSSLSSMVKEQMFAWGGPLDWSPLPIMSTSPLCIYI